MAGLSRMSGSASTLWPAGSNTWRSNDPSTGSGWESWNGPRDLSKGCGAATCSERSRTMSWQGLLRVLRLGFVNFARNAWLSFASTAVIAITLFIIGVFAIQSIVIVNTTQGIQDKLDLSIYFNDDVPEATI